MTDQEILKTHKKKKPRNYMVLLTIVVTKIIMIKATTLIKTATITVTRII